MEILGNILPSADWDRADNPKVLRYGPERWRLLHGAYEGVAEFAICELARAVQHFLPYTLEVVPADLDLPLEDRHLIVVGTAEGNRLIQRLSDEKIIDIPPEDQGYAIVVCDSPWGQGKRLGVIAGRDEGGMLHGVEDFCARVLGKGITEDYPPHRRAALDAIPDVRISEYPRIPNRGLWTWGQVVYDYRRFIDNLARLRLNTFTFWSDIAPTNAAAIIEYAHSRGVRVILGFEWGWGSQTDLHAITSGSLEARDAREHIKQRVLRNYDANYRHLGADGIYFQTLTEFHKEKAGGRSIASAACELVNEIAGALLEEQPGLYIQFGLHAMSILDDYTDLEQLDPRVSIAWEDAGVLPFSYEPVSGMERTGWSTSESLGTFEKTLDYCKRLATFREGCEFSMIAKGWTTLRWEDEFEHHGPFIMGERGAEFTRRRLEERQPRWDYVNALWMQHYPLAARFYREILDCPLAGMTVSGLVEDGLFEEAIQPSVALFAETLWDPYRGDKDILQPAMSPYYGRWT